MDEDSGFLGWRGWRGTQFISKALFPSIITGRARDLETRHVSMPDNSPEATARKFFTAYMAADMPAAVAHVCESAIQSMVDGWRARAREQRAAPTAEQYMEHDSQMPRAVAEYLASRDAGWRPYDRGWWEDELPGTTSADDLLATPAKALVARFLSALLRRDTGANWKVDWNVLGSVADGPDRVYVVFRCSGGRHRSEDGHERELRGYPRLLEMRRTEAGWCVVDPHVLQSGGGAWVLVRDS